MMVLKKKQVVGLTLIVLIAAAGFIQWIYTPKNEADTASKTASASSEAVKSADENIILYDDSGTDAVNGGETDKTGQAQYVSSSATTDKAAGEDYFANARLQRENAKSRAIATLNDIIKNSDSDAAAKKDAESKILQYADNQKKEAACESIIKAKGFSDCVVFINEENVTVVVKSKKLSEADAAKIQSVIVAQTDMDSKNVKIVEVA